MLFDIVHRYRHILTKHNIVRFRNYNGAHELVVEFTFGDGSQLSVKDYVFLTGERKYAYHWQAKNGTLRLRWDNAAHWRAIDTYPHHLHRGAEQNVEASEVRNLPQVFAIIARQLKRGKR